ncbi:hypothetical protein RD792_015598 [Penstemon davidsonii]|uniref:Uncharacterized protein n=1 Tax=Penstemon davidsonii TaxID=160366 RepID=A0ABR0CHD2_9LAMI|nr:hypothetical protein RD792_015598 [Penstemon davidsonii]
MGCTASKLDNEDTVRRCKERRRLMKEAVYARHHLAAAHSDYCRSLRITGSALVTFASGEPLPVSHHTPAILLRTPTAATKPSTFIRSPSPSPSLYTPPPPPPPISTTSSHHQKQPPPPPPRFKKPIKVPHILSDSSFISSPPPNHRNFTYAKANSTYSVTPSQASSVWNWDNFYPPPSPPDSEYFQNLHKNENNSDDDDDDKASSFTSHSKPHTHIYQNRNPFSRKNEANSQFDDSASSYSHYSDNTYRNFKQGPKKGQNLKQWESEEEEEEETEREEVQCSEWGDHDHYSSTSSSSNEDENEEGDLKSRSDFGTRSNLGSVKNEAAVNYSSKMSGKSEKVSYEDDGKSSVSWGNGNNNNNNGSMRMDSDMRMVVRHKDLGEIVAALREYFDKAASAGEQVSEMLETGRAQLDRSFNQLKKTVYHSNGMLSNLSSTWTSKPPLAVKYRYEPNTIEQSKSLGSTLERLLAWEKKLYQEVKAREGVKIEHEKKLSALQSQEYRREEESKLDKTKASIKRLQSLIAVTSQAVSTTSSAIVGLRDSDLVPQLVELCHGFMYMWRSMNQYHEIQNDIVQQVRGLINRTTKSESTSDLHRQATRDLESSVTTWHSSFCRLIKFQREFICSLHGWLKLTLLPVHNEPTNTKTELSEVFSFCDEWKLALDRIPDTVASEAIKSFINVVNSISLKQTEELKIKKRMEVVSKELEKKASSLRNIEKKYYHSYSMVGIGLPDSGPDNGHVLDARDPLADKKAELSSCQRRVEDEMIKHSKAVEVTRAMTLNNIQTGLPGVFQAMTSFSALITEALETVCNRSYAI